MNIKTLLLRGALAVTLGISSAIVLAQNKPPTIAPISQGDPSDLHHFSLIDAAGQRITEHDFPGKVLVVAFGYTHCPDVCPTTLSTIKFMLSKVAHPEKVQPIFITIDPFRDTPEKLGKYTHLFDKRIIGLSGTQEEVEAAAKSFGASYGYKHDGKKLEVAQLAGEPYEVYHSSNIYLIDSRGELLDVFDYQVDIPSMVEGINYAVKQLTH